MFENHEAVIIGGGPAGMTAGLYLMRGGIDSLLLEKIVPGGTPLNTGMIENYPGFPDGITGKELMGRFATHAKAFGLKVKEFSEVQSVVKTEDYFDVNTTEGSFRSKAVIVASGTVPKSMNVPGESQLIGMGVSYCATCDGMFFKNLDVAVVGGGDAAIEEALLLANIVNRVYVIHRRDTLRAQKILQDRAFNNEKIQFLWNKSVLQITGDNQVTGIVIEDNVTREHTSVPVSGVFVYIGSAPNTNFLKGVVNMDESGFIITDEEMGTNVPGLFAAGDVRQKSLRQIATSVGDAAMAAVNLEKYILQHRS